MKTTPLFALAPLALLTNACVARAVDDDITGSVELVIEDVDASCTESTFDELDPEINERVSGRVYPYELSGQPYCAGWGYYRGSILNFDNLRDDLPEGVDEVTWTNVRVDFDAITFAFEGIPEVPTGSFFEVGLAVATEDNLASFEEFSNTSVPLAAGYTGAALVEQTRQQVDGTLVHVGERNVPTAQPTPLDDLASDLLDGATTNGNGEVLAGIFNDAFEGGASDLYVLAGTVIGFSGDLPETPSDVTLTADFTISYQADAKVNLIGAARGAADAE